MGDVIWTNIEKRTQNAGIKPIWGDLNYPQAIPSLQQMKKVWIETI